LSCYSSDAVVHVRGLLCRAAGAAGRSIEQWRADVETLVRGFDQYQPSRCNDSDEFPAIGQ